MSVCEIRAKKALAGSSRRAAARRRRAAEMRVGEARWVGLEGMKRRAKEGVGAGRTAAGSAWT